MTPERDRLSGLPARAKLFLCAIAVMLALSTIIAYSVKEAKRERDTGFAQGSIDMQHYHEAGARAARGEIPHRDFFFEYPPTAAYLVAPPALGKPDIDYVTFAARYFQYAGGTFAISLALAWLLLLRRAPLIAMTGAFVTSVLLLRFSRELVIGRFDAIVAGMTLIAWILLLPRERLGEEAPAPTHVSQEGAAGILLGLAMGLKLYPALFILAYLTYRRSWQASRSFLIGVGVALAPTLLLAVLGTENFGKFLTYHSGRQFEIGSLYAAGGVLTGASRMAVEFGSAQIHFPGERTLLPISTLLTIVASLAPLLMAWRRRADFEAAFYAGLWGVFGFILFNKVGSPQYAVWTLVPALVAVTLPLRRGLPVLAGAGLFLLGASLEMSHYRILIDLSSTHMWIRVKVLTSLIAWGLCGWAFLSASARSETTQDSQEEKEANGQDRFSRPIST